jgi:hypothetical protein
MILRQAFNITGVANKITPDGGITSTPTELKNIVSVSLLVNGYADNEIHGIHEKATPITIPDRLIDVETDAFTENEAKPGARINELEVGLDLPLGETFKIAIKCGATAKNVWGTYNYELKK